MADEAGEQEVEEEAGASKPWALIGAAAGVALLLGAGGTYFMVGVQAEETPQAVAEEPPSGEDAEVEAATAAGADFQERLYSLEPFVVNVTGDGYSRYLKVKVELETNGPAVKIELDSRLAQVRDAMIVLLSSKQLADITDFEGKALLKEDMVLRVNDLLSSGRVESALFTEFVVQ